MYAKGSIATLNVIPRKHEAECIPKAVVPSVANAQREYGNVCVTKRLSGGVYISGRTKLRVFHKECQV